MLRWRHKYQARTSRNATPATPPTTPPAIARVFVEDKEPSGDGSFGAVAVGAAVIAAVVVLEVVVADVAAGVDVNVVVELAAVAILD